jgi:heme-degrading monooxygenase HmoA
MSQLQFANYVKYNKAVFKDKDKREEGEKTLLEFFKANEQGIKGFIGFLVMSSETDPKVSIVLTFWKSKESMAAFYNEENSTLTEFVNKLKPLLEVMPERIDYKVISFNTT